MSDEMQNDGTIDEPRRRGRPPKEGPDREARGERQETRAETGRQQRIPLGTPQAKLTANVPKNMVGRWVNDVGGRIQQALDGGYGFINDAGTTDSRESARCQIVGTKEDGSPMLAFLMAIPREWYEEDQKAKQKPIDDFEAEIRRGIPQGAEARNEQGRFYDRGSVIERRS